MRYFSFEVPGWNNPYPVATSCAESAAMRAESLVGDEYYNLREISASAYLGLRKWWVGN